MKVLEEGKVYPLDIIPSSIPSAKQQALRKIINQVMAKVVKGLPIPTTENFKDHPIYKWYEEITGSTCDIHAVNGYIAKPDSIIDESIRQLEFPDLTKWKSVEGTRLTKQLGKWFHFFWKYKLTSEESTNMGTILTISSTDKIWFRILNPRSEPVWEAGCYGDGGSCFWQSRADARATIEHNPRYRAMLFFRTEPPQDKLKEHVWLTDNNHTLGRCWLFEREKGGFVMFNGYFNDGKYQLANLHTSLAEMLETKSDKINLVNKGSTRARLWINEEGHGYLVADDADKIGSIDMNQDTEKIKCDHCQKDLSENEMEGVRALIVDGRSMMLCSDCRRMVHRDMTTDEYSFEEFNVFGSNLERPEILVMSKNIKKGLKENRIAHVERYNIYSAISNVTSAYHWDLGISKMERLEDVVFSVQLNRKIPRPDAVIIYTGTGMTWTPKSKIEKEKKDAETKNVGTSVPTARRTVSRSV